MLVEQSILNEVKIIKPEIHIDDRGTFLELFKSSNFKKFGLPHKFVQENQVFSRKGVLRGLHYQLNYPQGKLVRCVIGAILDVVVDIRKGSPNFAKFTVIEISAENQISVYVPEGFAHGYIVKSKESLVMYNCTNEYRSEDEYGIIWNDSRININWGNQSPIVSKKDSCLPTLYNQNFLPVY
jgi:dTDP-4-dehydrorhamnose 3,5-epimerase